jgi:hypothetical protein
MSHGNAFSQCGPLIHIRLMVPAGTLPHKISNNFNKVSAKYSSWLRFSIGYFVIY